MSVGRRALGPFVIAAGLGLLSGGCGAMKTAAVKGSVTATFKALNPPGVETVKLADEDVGRFIGKAGRNIEAIRTLVRVASSSDRKRVFVDLANAALPSSGPPYRRPARGGVTA